MPKNGLAYDELLRRLYRSPTYVAEMPDEYHRSRPLPTLRWRVAGFASFAGGCRRNPGPTLYLPPNRWIVADAETARILVYATVEACPFTDVPLEPCVSTTSAVSLSEARDRTARVDELVGLASAPFFEGEHNRDTRWGELASLLADEVGELVDWYRALVPDFFDWLHR